MNRRFIGALQGRSKLVTRIGTDGMECVIGSESGYIRVAVWVDERSGEEECRITMRQFNPMRKVKVIYEGQFGKFKRHKKGQSNET